MELICERWQIFHLFKPLYELVKRAKPKTKRKPTLGEDTTKPKKKRPVGGSTTCSNCEQVGHNKKTCKAARSISAGTKPKKKN